MNARTKFGNGPHIFHHIQSSNEFDLYHVLLFVSKIFFA
jgi:hypothetical protein